MGVLLRKQFIAKNKERHIVRHFLRVLGSYTIKRYAHEQVHITVDGKNFQTKTDDHGLFTLKTESRITDNIEIRIQPNGDPLEINQDYPVLFKYLSGPIDVISDIDDTIMVSHTANFFKRIGTLTLVRPSKRKAVHFSKEIIDYCKSANGRIHYVSKSESNLFGLISSVINYENLTKGMLFLTPFINFYELIFKSKAKRFKQEHIIFLLDNSSNKKFILLGDDTQLDMAIYTEIISTYPDRILQVYIRRTRKYLKPKKLQTLENLKMKFPNLVYFSDNDDLGHHLEKLREIFTSLNKQ